HWLDGIDKDGSEQPAKLTNVGDLQARAAQLAAERLACTAVRATGEETTGRLTAGHKVKLTHGTPSKAGLDVDTYLWTRVKLVADLDVRPHVDSNLRFRSQFECIPFAVPYRPPLRTPRPVATGVDTAVVTGPTQSDAFTDKHGRVRLQFHWDRTAPTDLVG